MDFKGYTNIPDWMLSLDLDVYETIILAVIYGFSQDGESTFAGSQNYLAKKAKCTRRKVALALPRLVERGLVEKIDKDVRGIKLCEYRVRMSFIGCEQYAQGGSACHSHNNIDIENKDISICNKKGSTRFRKPTLQEVADYCRERGNGIDAETFINHYESNGWMVGKTPMKNWMAAVRTWERNSVPQKGNGKSCQKQNSVLEHNLKVMDEMYGTSMHEQTYGKEAADEQ